MTIQVFSPAYSMLTLINTHQCLDVQLLMDTNFKEICERIQLPRQGNRSEECITRGSRVCGKKKGRSSKENVLKIS